MFSRKIVAAVTASVFALSPVAAQAANPASSLSVARVGATMEDSSFMGSEAPITAFIAAGILLSALAVLIIAQDDDEDDQPTSP